jgi:hypothetical protein
MYSINFYAGWLGILAGLLVGAAIGMFFHKDQWLGGYASWRRRVLRLGHIASVMVGILNILFAFSIHLDFVAVSPLSKTASILFLVGLVGMPMCCYAAAAHKPLRHLFPIPATCLIVGTALLFLAGA